MPSLPSLDTQKKIPKRRLNVDGASVSMLASPDGEPAKG